MGIFGGPTILTTASIRLPAPRFSATRWPGRHSSGPSTTRDRLLSSPTSTCCTRAARSLSSWPRRRNPSRPRLALLAASALGLVGCGWRRRAAKRTGSWRHSTNQPIHPFRPSLRIRPGAATVRLLLAAALAGLRRGGLRDVFHLGGGDTSLSFVTVGDPGNAGDTGRNGPDLYVRLRLGRLHLPDGQLRCDHRPVFHFLTPWPDRTLWIVQPSMVTDFSSRHLKTGSPGGYSYAVAGMSG